MTDDEKKQIVDAVLEALEIRRQRFRQTEDANKPVKVTKLYLLTLAGHHIAVPDARGKAIHHQAVYGRVEVTENDPHFYGGPIEIVAFGDGEKLAQSFNTILTGASVTALVEVSESILADMVIRN